MWVCLEEFGEVESMICVFHCIILIKVLELTTLIMQNSTFLQYVTKDSNVQ